MYEAVQDLFSYKSSTPYAPYSFIKTVIKEERKALRDYQIDSFNGINSSFERCNKSLLILPTGTGKTVVFAEIVKQFTQNKGRCLVLAHRDELINQAYDKIKLQAGIIPCIEKADKKAYMDSQCVIASVLTLNKKRITKFPVDHFKLIVVDEAHHAIAPSYQQILNYFQGAKVLGVTATPDRSDDKELGNYFEEIAFQYSLVEAIKNDYLSNIIGRKVEDFTIDLSELRTFCGDFVESELEGIIEKYIAPISSAIAKETKTLKTMIFLPSVKSSELVANVLKEMGIKAAYLSGATEMDERKQVIAEYKSGNITHLCNCNLFLEGFDEPSIECIVMARPTMSRTIYAQAVGRGTRKYPGKDHLKLVEFTYNFKNHKLVNAYELFTAKGFEEKVRALAEKKGKGKPDVDFLMELEEASKDTYDIERILKNIKIKDDHGFMTFDPFELCNLRGIDLNGELEIKWNGHTLKGEITPKQSQILGKYGINHPELLSKAQASKLIDLIAQNGWKVENIMKVG